VRRTDRMARTPYGAGSSGHRAPGVIATVTLLVALAWAGQLGYGIATGGPLGIRARIPAFEASVYASYATGLAFVVATTAVFAALYAHAREGVPVGAAVGFAFVPVYTVLGLAGYATGLALPRLAALGGDEAVRPTATLLPGIPPISTAGTVLAAVLAGAYAVLAVPALVFGGVLVAEWRGGLGTNARLLAGLLFGIAAVAWLLGPAGVVVGDLAYATTAGTGLYALGLLALAVEFLP